MPILPKLFDINDHTNWKKNLDKNGFVVIKNILSNTEQIDYISQFKSDLNTVSPNLDCEDKSTWTIENTPMMFHKGMCIFNGFGQCDFMWKLRTNNNIIDIYRKLHNTDSLCVSLDGFSVFLSNKQKTKSWLHIDQNPSNPMYSIQGAYNFNRVGPDDAGFVVVPRSHLTYKPEVTHKRDWIQCGDNDEIESRASKLLIPANCFTLWNSKLIHCNTNITKTLTNPLTQSTQNKIEFNRLTCYITYLPKKYRPENVLGKRILAYKNGETTSHWANKCELKRYPWGFGKRYEERGFNRITPTLDNENGNGNDIPIDRMELL